MANKPTTGMTLQVLRISDSGQAALLLNPDLPESNNTEWFPLSVMDEESAIACVEGVNELGPVDLNIQDWILRQKGWD